MVSFINQMCVKFRWRVVDIDPDAPLEIMNDGTTNNGMERSASTENEVSFA